MKYRFIFLGILLVAIDQSTKYFSLTAGNSVINTGISLGVFDSFSSEMLTILLALVLLGTAFFLRKEWQRYPVCATFFFAGSLSNLIDRVLYEGVIDWLPIPLVSVYNNLADWYIFIAILSLLIVSLKPTKHAKHPDHL